jgi:Na+-transporting methylmalonyl-CoA/oxaloacetate decarboxylase gamma subunit
VTLPFDHRTRVLLLLLVLVAAAGGLGLMIIGRSQSQSEASPEPVAPPRTTTVHSAPRTTTAPAPAATKPAVTPATTTATTAAPPAAARAKKAAAAERAAADQTRLPAAIRAAFAQKRPVVVALYDPKARIDGTALAEADAGARLAGTVFVPIDVTGTEVDALNLRYGVIQDPAVLVLRPPGTLVIRIDGFADRDTVAQAAANAAS